MSRSIQANVTSLPGAIIGYYHQDHRTLDFKLDPVKQVEVLRPDMQYGDIRAALGRFQFSKERVTTPLGKLSGGEARVALLKLLLEENNLLLLDEPTNHLDMDAKDLEEALVEYDGAIVTVSHDRWFLDQVVNQIWELQDGIVTKYYGNYTDYIREEEGTSSFGGWRRTGPVIDALDKYGAHHITIHWANFITC